jgi:prevent-host-death family protein
MDKDDVSPPAVFSDSEAQERLPELVDRALKGESVIISRDGQPAVELKPIAKLAVPRRVTQDDIEWLKARRVGRKMREDAGTFVSRMRDEDWERF